MVRWLVNSQDPVILRDPAASVAADRGRSRTRPGCPSSSPPTRRSTSGFVLAVTLCTIVWFILKRTTFGFEVSTVGTNPNAAKYAGMGVNRTIIVVMALSGRLRRPGRRRRDHRHLGLPQPRRVRRHRVRRHRHRPAGPGQPVRASSSRRSCGARCCRAPGSCSRRAGCRSTPCGSCRRSSCCSWPPTSSCARSSGCGATSEHRARDHPGHLRLGGRRREPLPVRAAGRPSAPSSASLASFLVGYVAPQPRHRSTRALTFEPPPDPAKLIVDPADRRHRHRHRLRPLRGGDLLRAALGAPGAAAR